MKASAPNIIVSDNLPMPSDESLEEIYRVFLVNLGTNTRTSRSLFIKLDTFEPPHRCSRCDCIKASVTRNEGEPKQIFWCPKCGNVDVISM